MAKRSALEQLAIRLYAGGKSMEEISAQLDVSQTTLYKWKAESKSPAEPMDEWDKARANSKHRKNSIERSKDLLAEQLTFLEELKPSERTPPMFDSLAKIGALVKTLGKMEEEVRTQVLTEAANTVEASAKQGGLSDEAANYIRKQILGLSK